MWPYPSEADALRDVLRLSKAMTYKLVLADVPAGGAKSVIVGNPAIDKTEALLHAFGRGVDRLGGRYIIGEDVGTNARDMAALSTVTSFVMAQQVDTSAATGRGVFFGMRTCAGICETVSWFVSVPERSPIGRGVRPGPDP